MLGYAGAVSGDQRMIQRNRDAGHSIPIHFVREQEIILTKKINLDQEKKSKLEVTALVRHKLTKVLTYFAAELRGKNLPCKLT